MLTQKVKDYFEKYPDLKVLFYFDPSGEYKTEIENWQEQGIHLVIAKDEQFGLKHRVEDELKDKKVFLYLTRAMPLGDERKLFALMDILTSNKVLHIDDVEEIVQEFELRSYQRALVAKYKDQLKIKKNKKTLSKILNPYDFDEQTLQKGLISCFLNSASIDDEPILIAKLFIYILNNVPDDLLSKIRGINAEDILRRLIDDYFDIDKGELTRDVLLLAVRKYKYSLITQSFTKTSPADNYAHLKIKKQKKINLINLLTAEWQSDPKLAPLLDEVFEKLAPDVKEEELVKLYGVEAEYGYYNEKITVLILAELTTYIDFNPDRAITLLTGIHSHLNSNLNNLKRIIEYLIRCADVYKVVNSIPSMVFDKPKNYLEVYIDKYHLVDYNFRKAFVILDELQTVESANELGIEDVTAKLNEKYSYFVKEMNTQWMKCLQDHDFEFSNIPVLKQNEFYKHFIEGTEQKIAVIISDGLRYEAARELMNTLNDDPKHQAVIEYMLSGLPSNTKLGMANLLPNKVIELKNELFVVDSLSTEGVENREKILRNYDPDSKAIQYDKLIQLTKDESREFFKTKITYIYHNRIDAIGDDRKTEQQTFDAVERAISELAPLIKKIHSTYNVAKIIVTADHGFIFNPVDLPESMYEALPDKNAVVNHNRFSILKKEIKTDSYIFNLSKASSVKSDFILTIPKAINRYKRQGHGALYVHGGASLQEMIIPVIESARKREDVTEKVTFKLLNKEIKIVSNALKLKFIQEIPVNKDYKEISLSCGIYGNVDDLVSNEISITLDSTSELPTQRIREIILNLVSKSISSSILLLKVFDKEKDPNKLNPLIKEKVINQTLIQSEFD